MHSNLHGQEARDLGVISSRYGLAEGVLTGPFSPAATGLNRYVFDAGGSDRIITLPATESGRHFEFVNKGSSGNLVVKDESGTTLATAYPRHSVSVLGDESQWNANNVIFRPAGPLHSPGLVPDPGVVTGLNRFLMDDGTWTSVTSVGIVDAYKQITDGTNTSVAAGLSQFKLRSSDTSVAVVVTENDATHGDNADLTVNEAAVNHNTLLNYVANQHVDHSTVSISAGNGLSGGGAITASRTLSLDINGLVAATPVLGDSIAIYDLSATTVRKSLISDVNAILNHNTLLNYVANQHIDHSTVSISAGLGLTGGGTIAASRTLSLDITGQDAQVPVAADEIIYWDADAADYDKCTFAQFNTILSLSTMSGSLGLSQISAIAAKTVVVNSTNAIAVPHAIASTVPNQILNSTSTSLLWTATPQLNGLAIGIPHVATNGIMMSLGGTTISTGLYSGTGEGFVAADSGLFRFIGTAASAPAMSFVRALGTATTPLIVADTNIAGTIFWNGFDGAARLGTAKIHAIVDGTPSSGVMPLALEFFTGPTNTSIRRYKISPVGSHIWYDTDSTTALMTLDPATDILTFVGSGVQVTGSSSLPFAVTRLTGATNTGVNNFYAAATTSGTFVDGFGPQWIFAANGAAGQAGDLARMRVVRDGNDNTGKFVFAPSLVAVPTDIFEINSVGTLTTVSASPGVQVVRNTVSTSGTQTTNVYRVVSSGDMVDTFGILHSFNIQDNAGVINTIVSERWARFNGADTTGIWVSSPRVLGVATDTLFVVGGAIGINKAPDIGVGTTTRVDILGDGPPPFGSSGMRFKVRAFGGVGVASNPEFNFWAGRGTYASPESMLIGDRIAMFAGGGSVVAVSADSISNTGAVVFQAQENFTTTAKGTSISFESTPNGTAARVGTMFAHGGTVTFPNISTTASAANAFLDSGGGNNLLRSTSALKYKKDIKPIDAAQRKDIINRLEPFRYKSTIARDGDTEYVGFGAEDVAAIDPSLVHWGYDDEEDYYMDFEPDGDSPHSGRLIKRLKPSAVKRPVDVQYARMVCLLIDEVKDLRKLVDNKGVMR